MKMNWADKHPDKLALYLRVSRQLAAEIQHQYRPGDILPSENQLAKRFGINRNTLRMALEVLVTNGMVCKYQGKGTIVQQQLINYPIHAGTRFTENLESSGRQAESQVLRKIGIPALPEVADSLHIEEDEPVILIEVLRKMDGSPFSVSSHYFPLEKMFEVMRKYESGSLHGFIGERYGIRLKRVLSLISAILPDQRDMKFLGISGNAPILRVKSVNVDQDTKVPVEFVVSRFKGVSTELSVQPD